MSHPLPQRTPRLPPLLLLSFILIAALLLRLYQLDAASFWLDEILTVELSVGRGYPHLDLPQDQLIASSPDFITLDGAPPAYRIWTSLDRDVHPPLFYLVLRAWREIFGDGDFRLRLLSVVLSLGAIAMLYFAVEPLSGSAAALWACALMALAGPQIEYAQELRSYTLLLLCLLGTAAVIVRIEKLGPSTLRCAVLVLALLASLLTHYSAWPAIAAMCVYALLRLRGRALRWTIASFGIGGVVLAAAWGPFLVRQMRGFDQRIEFTLGQSSTALQTLERAAELPLRFFTDAPVPGRWIGLLAMSLYIIPLLRLRRRPDLLPWCVWLVGYVSFVTMSDLIRHADALGWIRYTLAASPAAYALAAALLADAKNPWLRHGIPAALCIACIAALPEAYEREKADWRAIAGQFAAGASEDHAMIFQSSGPDDWRARCMYVCVRYYAPRPEMPLAMLSKPEPDVLRALDGRDVWLFGGGQNVPLELVPGWQRVEWDYIPGAGTITRLRDEPRRD